MTCCVLNGSCKIVWAEARRKRRFSAAIFATQRLSSGINYDFVTTLNHFQKIAETISSAVSSKQYPCSSSSSSQFDCEFILENKNTNTIEVRQAVRALQKGGRTHVLVCCRHRHGLSVVATWSCRLSQTGKTGKTVCQLSIWIDNLSFTFHYICKHRNANVEDVPSERRTAARYLGISGTG